MVHLEAGRRGLVGIPREDCPSALAAIRAQGHLVLPLAALVYLLFAGYTPLFAGTVGLALTAVLIFGSGISARLGALGWRVLFWMLLGIVSASFFRYGIDVMVGLIALLVAAQPHRRAAGAERSGSPSAAWSRARATPCRSASLARWWASSSAP